MGARPAFLKPPLEVNVAPIVRVAKALRRESNGVQMRKDLIKGLRLAVDPGVQKVRSVLRSMPGSEASPALGSYLASRVRTQVRLTGKSAGVRIRIGTTPNIRDFKMAARRLNRPSWRRKVYGKKWVTQVSPIPGYFDQTLADGKARYSAAVYVVLRKFGRRVGESVGRP